MKLSFFCSLLFLILKYLAYTHSGAQAVLSDLIEALLHSIGVGFSLYALGLSRKPPDRDHRFGHDRVVFFAAGFEGFCLCSAGVFLLFCSQRESDLQFSSLSIVYLLLSLIFHFFLALFLYQKGKKEASFLLQSHAKHLLCDTLTTVAALSILIGQLFFDIHLLDKMFAGLIGGYLVFSGWKMLKKSLMKLMDQTDPLLQKKIEIKLKETCEIWKVDCHDVRHRESGQTLFIETHLVFPDRMSVLEAHGIATHIEKDVKDTFSKAEFISHLEPRESHDVIHQQILGRSR